MRNNNEPISVLVLIEEAGAGGDFVTALADDRYQAHVLTLKESPLATLYTQPPDCILLPFGPGAALAEARALLNQLKESSVYGHIPVILYLAAEAIPDLDWWACPADDYLIRPVSPEELRSRIDLCLARTRRDMNANPLTGLPGNVSILRELERRLRLETPFAAVYFDLDHFKPFNDKYGFSRGDEVLRMTARLLKNLVAKLGGPNAFTGHIGGDDFFLILDPDRIKACCEAVIQHFDEILPSFYDEEDRKRGGITSIDRKGNPQRFPLMTCSIAVIDSRITRIEHVAHLSARAAEVKSYAKTIPHSSYLVDRRG